MFYDPQTTCAIPFQAALWLPTGVPLSAELTPAPAQTQSQACQQHNACLRCSPDSDVAGLVGGMPSGMRECEHDALGAKRPPPCTPQSTEARCSACSSRAAARGWLFHQGGSPGRKLKTQRAMVHAFTGRLSPYLIRFVESTTRVYRFATRSAGTYLPNSTRKQGELCGFGTYFHV
jgi:hypothetical protein